MAVQYRKNMSADESINILCNTDDNYVPYYGIMLTSLFECNKDCRFEVYVFADDKLSKSNEEKLVELGTKYGNKVIVMPIDETKLKDCPVSRLNNLAECSYLNLIAYYRLLAADLLPTTVHKIIYLDGDIIINGGIRPLWNVDLEGKAIAFARDCDEVDKETERRLGYASAEGYYNAGVAVYNLDYWRDHDVSNRLFSFIREKGALLKYMDQDAVNGVLWGEKIALPARFNFQVTYFAPYFWINYSDGFRKDLLEDCNKAVVIHYCCALKPWDFRYYGGPFYDVWEKYRKMSLWKDARITKPLKTYAKFMLKKALLPNRLKKQRQGLWVVLPENEMCY